MKDIIANQGIIDRDLANKQANFETEESIRNIRASGDAYKQKVLDGLNSDNDFLTRENHKLKEYINRPLSSIIDENEDLKKKLKEQEEIIKDWIVSQTAFKQIAYKYGEIVGKTDDEIFSEYKEEKAIQKKRKAIDK